MKYFKLLLALTAIIMSAPCALAQKKEKQIITAVKFEEDNIILNNKVAFKYSKVGNDFVINDLDGNEIIKGSITQIGDKKYTSVITFVTINKEFSNKKIIGRNDLIFAMCENNVFTKKFEIDPDKLSAFLEKYNELK